MYVSRSDLSQKYLEPSDLRCCLYRMTHGTDSADFDLFIRIREEESVPELPVSDEGREVR